MPYKNPDVARKHSRDANRRRRQRAREARWDDRKGRVWSRNSPPMEDCIWAAGHFEGEGTVTMSPYGNHMRVAVSLTSTDRDVAEFFQSRWGGSIRTFRPKSLNNDARDAHIWAITGSEAVECCMKDLEYWTRTDRVRKKIQLALADIADRLPFQRDEQAHLRSRERMAVMRQLNQRGRSRPDVVDIPDHLMLEGPK